MMKERAMVWIQDPYLSGLTLRIHDSVRKVENLFFIVQFQGICRQRFIGVCTSIIEDYTNWVEGPQDATLFEVPAGYTKR